MNYPEARRQRQKRPSEALLQTYSEFYLQIQRSMHFINVVKLEEGSFQR
jgi:hypothetical protein